MPPVDPGGGGRRTGIGVEAQARGAQFRAIHANALINGKAIKIEGGNYRIISEKRIFRCKVCEHHWEEKSETARPKDCPACYNDEFYRISDTLPEKDASS